MRFHFVIIGLLTLMAISGTIVHGDDDAVDKRARAARLDVMTKRWQTYRALLVRDEREIKVSPIAKPLLRWTDEARNDAQIKDGTLWAWKSRGRPVALFTQESYGERWAFELISASTGRIAVVTNDNWRWSPEKPGLQFHAFEDGLRPAENTAARLTQMKSMASRFEIVQIGHDETVYKLRLMPRPIHRYDDASSGLIDGALFVFAWGTNPEAIVVIEYQQDAFVSAWRYGFLPVTVARVEAKVDGKMVWSRPAAFQPRLQEPYTAFGSE